MKDLVFKYNLTINSIKIILLMEDSTKTATQLTNDLGVSRRTIDRCIAVLLKKDLIELSWIQTDNEKNYQLIKRS